MPTCTIWDECDDLVGPDEKSWEGATGTYNVSIYGTASIYAERAGQWTDVMCRGWGPEDWSTKDYLSIYIAGYPAGTSGAANQFRVYLYDSYAGGPWPYGHVAQWYIGGLTQTLREFQLELNRSGSGTKPNSVEVDFDWTSINKIRIRGGGNYVAGYGYTNNDIYFDYLRLCIADESPPTGPQTEEQAEATLSVDTATQQEEERASAGEPSQSAIARRRIRNYTQIVGVAPTNPTSAPIPTTWDPTGAEWVYTNPSPVLPVAATLIYSGAATVATTGTRSQLTATSIPIMSITVKANGANAGDVYVGNQYVTIANGFELGPGESISMNIDNINKVWIDAANNGDGVTFIAIGT